MEKQFKARNDKKHRFRKGVDSWKRYYTSLLFLRSLWGEISRLKDTRDPSGVFGGGRKFQGDNLIELLKYMSRNGLVFAPAPNVDDHFAYHSVFKQMRDLYVTVADEDPALKPVRPRSRN